MPKAEQGSILKISGIPYPVLVVSKDFFNETDHVLVCPILSDIIEGPLHIELNDPMIKGYVACEQIKYVDLASRRFTKVTNLDFYDIMNVSDAIMGIFDYQ